MNQKNGIGQKDDLLSLDPKYFGPFWDYIQEPIEGLVFRREFC